jgi:hypothetical protein
MNKFGKTVLALAAALAIGVALGVTVANVPTARGSAEQGDKPAGRFTVVETEGHNLIVTDNQTQTLYFYTIDKDAELGSDLKLRGTMDLNQVGKDKISPRKINMQK